MHCVRDTGGAQLHPEAALRAASTRSSTPGASRDDEGYSGFEDTELERLLRDQDVDTVHVAGLALDYCVKATALDARRAGFDVVLHRGATRAVDVEPGDGERAVEELRAAGVEVVELGARRLDALDPLLEDRPRRRACGGPGTWPRSPAAARPAPRCSPFGSRSTSLNWVGQPRSAGVYSHSTSTGPMSQPLRLAYISIVIAVHDARLAASSSCGLGPSSSPPCSGGSSAVSWWWRMSIRCVNVLVLRRAVAFIVLVASCIVASPRRLVVSVRRRAQSSGLNSSPVGTLGKK